MAGIRLTLSAFNSGYLNKTIRGAADLQNYNQCLQECLNFQLPYFGGAFLRPGTQLLSAAPILKSNRNNVVLKTFSFENGGEYLLEFSESRIRVSSFEKVNIQTLVSTFLDAEISRLSFVQKKYSILICSPDKGLFILNYNGVDPIIFEEIKSIDFSFTPLIQNEYQAVLGLKPSARSGNITLTPVSLSAGGGNPPDYCAPVFYPTDVGRILTLTYINLEQGTLRYFLKIKAINNTASAFRTATCELIDEYNRSNELPDGLNPVSNFMLPALGGDIQANRGYPNYIVSYEGRMFIIGGGKYSDQIWGSSINDNDFLSFKDGALDGDAINITISSSQHNYLKWGAALNKLFVSDGGNMYLLKGDGGFDAALKPSNISCRPFWRGYPGDLPPTIIDDSMFFTTLGGSELYEIILDAQSMQFNCLSLSLTASELFESGIRSCAWQLNPGRYFWIVCGDGTLVCITYLRGSSIAAFSRHKLGGDAMVKACGILSEAGKDYLYLYSNRYINGVLNECIERLTLGAMFENNEFEAKYLDAHITCEQKYPIVKATPSKTDLLKIMLRDFKRLFDNNQLNSFLIFFDFECDLDLPHPLRSASPFWADIKTPVDGRELTATFAIMRDIRYLNIINDDGSIRQKAKIKVSDYPNFDNNLNYNIIPYWFGGEIIDVDLEKSQIKFNFSFKIAVPQNAHILLYKSGITDNLGISLDYEPVNRERYFLINKGNNWFSLQSIDGVSIIFGSTISLSKYASVFISISNVRIPGYNYTIGKNAEFYLEKKNYELLENNCLYLGIDNSYKYNGRYIIETVSDIEGTDYFKITLYNVLRGGANFLELPVPFMDDLTIFSDFYKVIGEAWALLATAAGFNTYKSSEVDIVADGKYIGRNYIDNDGKLDFHKIYNSDFKTLCVGHRYNAQLKTMPIFGGSALGSSYGAIGTLREVFLSLYKSRNGTLGINNDSSTIINYPNIEDFFTGEIRLDPPSADYSWDRSINISHEGGESFNIRSITVSAYVNDN